MERGVSSGGSEMNTEQILDYIDTTNNETRKADRRRRVLRPALGSLAVIGLSVGGISGVNNIEGTQVVEKTVEGGQATVKRINYKFKEQRVISFLTEVDGSSVADVLKRTGPFGVPLPDIEAGMRVDDYVADSALCFDSKSKEIDVTTYPDSDKRHFRVEIDPADIRVCSKQDMSAQAISTPTGNIIEFINNASDDVNRAFGINGDSVEAENKKKSALVQDAQSLALYTVNTECGPLVFDKAKDEMKQLIADDVPRTENDTVEVVYTVGKSGEVAITGQSELDAKIKKMQEEGRKIDLGSVGECKVPESVAGDVDER